MRYLTLALIFSLGACVSGDTCEPATATLAAKTHGWFLNDEPYLEVAPGTGAAFGAEGWATLAPGTEFETTFAYYVLQPDTLSLSRRDYPSTANMPPLGSIVVALECAP